MQRLPDRTGIFILPLCAMLSGWIASALLVGGLAPSDTPSWERHVLDSMIAALATTLGPTGVAGATVVLAIPPTLWFVRALRAYRAQVAIDRSKMVG